MRFVFVLAEASRLPCSASAPFRCPSLWGSFAHKPICSVLCAQACASLSPALPACVLGPGWLARCWGNFPPPPPPPKPAWRERRACLSACAVVCGPAPVHVCVCAVCAVGVRGRCTRPTPRPCLRRPSPPSTSSCRTRWRSCLRSAWDHTHARAPPWARAIGVREACCFFRPPHPFSAAVRPAARAARPPQACPPHSPRALCHSLYCPCLMLVRACVRACVCVCVLGGGWVGGCAPCHPVAETP